MHFYWLSFSKKGYKVYDLTSNKCFITRDVIFQEKVFPFSSNSNSNTSSTSLSSYSDPIIDLHLDHISSPVLNSSLVRAISSGEMNTSLGFNPYLVKSISSYYESDSLSPQNLEFSTDPHISHNRNSSPTPPLSSTC